MESFDVTRNEIKDPAYYQLEDFKKNEDFKKTQNLTTLMGCPIGDSNNMITVGPRGPVLMQDNVFIQEMAHFNRERIPERIVHAKGSGAFGYFEVTRPEITRYCRAALFNRVGKRTPLVARLSTVIRQNGSADTIRDARGLAAKFYTEEGNWDLICLNTPVFFIRDSSQFPSFLHSSRRNTQTNINDNNALWDFLSLRTETLFQLTVFYSDLGIPDGYRYMNGWAVNTFKLVNSNNEPIYARWYLESNQGIKNLDVNVANELAASDPDYAIRDLYNAIERKDYPSWTLFVQVMTYEQAAKWQFNPFDVTKIWPTTEFPYIEVGRMTLNRNPSNWFAEIEQLALHPGNRVPGIEFSPDKMLQGRLVAYADAHRYRLGTNHHLIAVNRTIAPSVHPTIRDGQMIVDSNQGNSPNYYPNSFLNARNDPKYNTHRYQINFTDVDRFETKDEDNYTQVRSFYLSFTDDERQRLFNNIANDLYQCYDFIRERAIKNFERVHPSYSEGVSRAIQVANNSNKNKF